MSPNSKRRSLRGLFQGVVQTLFMGSTAIMDDDELDVSTSADNKDFFLDNTSHVSTSVLLWSDHCPNQQLCSAYLYDNNGIQTDIWRNLMFSRRFLFHVPPRDFTFYFFIALNDFDPSLLPHRSGPFDTFYSFYLSLWRFGGLVGGAASSQTQGPGFISWPGTSCQESYVLPVSARMFPPATSAF